MRTLIVSGLALTLASFLLPSSAAAQSCGDVPSWERQNCLQNPGPPAGAYRNGYQRPQGYYRPRPEPDYYRPPQSYYRPPPSYFRPPSYGYAQPRPSYQRFSAMCVTSRGNCSTGRPIPVGSPCRCFIPGFGQKRGAVEEAY